ncbi:MAG: dihydroorotate dehydrogenase 2 [Chloroflexi bacterium]|nr:dihydroorotate dehydrogenase 2 [Chloroflexota bacterium]
MSFIYRYVIRLIVFRLPPEVSHRFAVVSFRFRPIWKLFGIISRPSGGDHRTVLSGIEIPNPVGIAAGFDKDCEVLGSLQDVGFGYVVGGTITLDARPGNPKPRMLRKSKDGALVNALGFPGHGLEPARSRLAKLSPAAARRTLISISGTEDDPIRECLIALEPLVAGIEVNISSPNTAGLAVFQEPVRLKQLLDTLVSSKSKPLFVKMPRLSDTGAFLELIQAAHESGADGFVVANTLPIEHQGLAVGKGGLSGKPLLKSTIELVGQARNHLGDGPTVIGCGGISNAEDARVVMEAGADAIQIYTALVYEGPGVASAISRGLRSGS